VVSTLIGELGDAAHLDGSTGPSVAVAPAGCGTTAPVAALLTRLKSLRGAGLAGESFWGLVIETVTLVGTFLSFAFLGRSLGPGGYGAYASLYAIVGPLVTLAASGVTLALLQHVVREREDLAETARSCLSLSLAFGVALTVIGMVAALLIVEKVAVIAMAAILVTEFVTMPVVHVAATAVQAVDTFGASARIRLVVLVARIAVLSILFATDSLTIASLAVSMFAVSTVVGVASLRVVGRRFGFVFLPGRVRGSHLRTNLVYSAGISADALGNEGDKLVLASNKLVVDTGLYAAAYRIIQLGLVPVGSVIQATHTRFLHHEDGLRGQHLRRATRYAVIGAVYGVVFAIGVIIVAPLLPLVVGKDFEGSVQMVRWLSPIVLLRAVGSCSINALMGLNKVTLRTVLIAINAAGALVLYIVLIPIMGWQGAAVATVISEALSVVMTWSALVVCQRKADRALDEELARGPEAHDEVEAPRSAADEEEPAVR